MYWKQSIDRVSDGYASAWNDKWLKLEKDSRVSKFRRKNAVAETVIKKVQLVWKLTKLRIFGDENDSMNLDICQVEGSFLVVSQFTLHALTKKGNRPSFIRAARPEQAIPLYELFLKRLAEVSGREVQSGEFGAMMAVELLNDGPVTIIMDSKRRE